MCVRGPQDSLVIVGPVERVQSGEAWQVDVVADYHDVTVAVAVRQATGGIGDDQRLHPQQLEHPHREGYLQDRAARSSTPPCDPCQTAIRKNTNTMGALRPGFLLALGQQECPV